MKAIYGDSNQPIGHRIKSAAAALPFEVPKLMPERAPLELKAELGPSLEERYLAQKERADRIERERPPPYDTLVLPSPGVKRNGNGGNGEDHS